jgi:hypothetical protein
VNECSAVVGNQVRIVTKMRGVQSFKIQTECFFFFPRQQLLRESSSELRYMHIVVVIVFIQGKYQALIDFSGNFLF